MGGTKMGKYEKAPKALRIKGLKPKKQKSGQNEKYNNYHLITE